MVLAGAIKSEPTPGTPGSQGDAGSLKMMALNGVARGAKGTMDANIGSTLMGQSAGSLTRRNGRVGFPRVHTLGRSDCRQVGSLHRTCMVRILGLKMKPRPPRHRRLVLQAPLLMRLLCRRRLIQRQKMVDGVPTKPLALDAPGVSRGLVKQAWTGHVLISVRPFGPYGCPQRQAPAVCFASCTSDGGTPLRTR